MKNLVFKIVFWAIAEIRPVDPVVQNPRPKDGAAASERRSVTVRDRKQYKLISRG